MRVSSLCLGLICIELVPAKQAASAPAVAFNGADGQKHTLASFKGHYIRSVSISSSQSPAVRVASGEYRNISFIHEVEGPSVADVTEEILAEAALPEVVDAGTDLQASSFDHAPKGN